MLKTEDLRPLGDPGSDQFQLEAYPFYLLNRLANRYNTAIEKELRTIGIDIPTWRVLMILGEHEPVAIGQIAKSAVINLSTMMRIVERMTGAGHVETAASVQDGRVTEVRLTPEGRVALDRARQVTAPLYNRIIKGFSARDFARTIELLNRLYENLG